MRLSAIILAGAGALAVLALAACQREADKAARTDAQAASYTPPTTASAASSRASRAPAPTFADGKPTWAASRQRSAGEGAQRQFDRNGAAFSAATLDDYVAKAHAFIDAPPRGSLTAVRANGDTLIYDPKGNVFAVADRQGAPRTMFKPRTGSAYWEQQKQQLADSGSRRGSRRASRASTGDDDSG